MRKELRKKIANGLDFIVFTAPALIIIVLITIIPFILNLYYAMFDWNGVSQNMKFIGLNNFIRFFTRDYHFFDAVAFNLRFSLFYVIIVNVLAVFFAFFLSRTGVFSSISRACYYIPHIVSLTAVSLMWRFILGPGFDSLYELTGLEFFHQGWMGSVSLAFYTVIAFTVWQSVGFYVIVYVAGIMGIPNDIEEAAEIDGSHGIRHFFHITLPLIMPSVTVCVFTALMYAFKLFDVVLVFTGGGPGGSTTTVSYNIYIDAFQAQRYGMATAKSVVFFIAVLIVTVIQLTFFKQREVQA